MFNIFRGEIGSGTLSGKMVLVSIVENNKIYAYFMAEKKNKLFNRAFP